MTSPLLVRGGKVRSGATWVIRRTPDFRQLGADSGRSPDDDQPSQVDSKRPCLACEASRALAVRNATHRHERDRCLQLKPRRADSSFAASATPRLDVFLTPPCEDPSENKKQAASD
jgi:hypothetical protein